MLTANEVAEVARGTPPVVVSAMHLFGWTLDQWAYLLTVIYTALLIGHFVYKHWLRKFAWVRLALGNPLDDDESAPK